MPLRAFPLLLSAALALAAGCGNDDAPGRASACPAVTNGEGATLRVATGNLCGTVRMPEGGGPHVVALLVPGSGPLDRDGNSADGVRTDVYAQLAEVLARRGVASLRYDKRGVGASAGTTSSEIELRPEDEADDVAGWIAQLKADARFGKVVVIGHSEGALLAMIAMQRTPAAAFISLAGPGRRMTEVFHDQLAQKLDGPLLARADGILDRLASGQLVPDLPAELADPFRPSVQPYLQALLPYEGAALLANLAMPTLIAAGTTDRQVPVEDARALAGARPDASVLVVDGMCHTLKMALPSDADQAAALYDRSRPLATALVEAIDAFLDRSVSR
jgi:pimeloyl-ACP methyl ester carboxylesterase